MNTELTELVFVLDNGEVDINHDRFSMEIMNHLQKHLPEHHRAEKIIFVITTNESENSSEYFIQDFNDADNEILNCYNTRKIYLEEQKQILCVIIRFFK